MFDALLKITPGPIKNALNRIRHNVFDGFAKKSYSQEGEDMILGRIFEGKAHGFYIDVGAHAPQRFSNTHYFYKRGWSGINIEPNPDAIRDFNSLRPRDLNLQCGISENEGVLTYHIFDEPALNTFDEAMVKARLATTHYKILGSADIPVTRLDKILEKHLPVTTKIDFLTVDVEGFDLSVLKSNNWNRYRPTCVLSEVLNVSLEEALNGELSQFMRMQGYCAFARTGNTLIFLESGK